MALTDDRIGLRVRLLREQKGLTREQLALAASVSTSTVARLELQDRLPSTSNTLRIAAALDVEVGHLLDQHSAEPAPAHLGATA